MVDDEQLRALAGRFASNAAPFLSPTNTSQRAPSHLYHTTGTSHRPTARPIGSRRVAIARRTLYGAIYRTGELRMLVINAPGAAVVTTTEVKRDVPGTFKVAESHRVYVTKDGQPIGGIVSVAMMEFLEEALSDRQMARVAARRHSAVVKGVDELLEADDFFAQADAAMRSGPRR